MEENSKRTPVPELTDEERRENLEKARAAKRRRAQVLENVRSGSLGVAEVLGIAEHDEAVSRMRAFTLIRAVPGYGFAKTQQLMKRLGIAESRRLRGLGVHQRSALCEQLGGAA